MDRNYACTKLPSEEKCIGAITLTKLKSNFTTQKSQLGELQKKHVDLDQCDNQSFRVLRSV